MAKMIIVLESCKWDAYLRMASEKLGFLERKPAVNYHGS